MGLPKAYQDFWWPFLLTKGRTVGPRMVLAPPFVIDHNLTGLLMDACALPEELHDRVAYREVLGSDVGNFTIVYRVIRANADLIGKASSGVLLDDSSRPVDLTEGILCLCDKIDGLVPPWLLDQMQIAAEKAFRSFWEADDPYATTAASQPLTVPTWASSSTPIAAEAVPRIDLRPVAGPVARDVPAPYDFAGAEPRRGKGCRGLLLLLFLATLFLASVAIVW